MNQPTKCADCGGALKKKTITYTHPWGGDELYQFENVPAFVCQQCGYEWGGRGTMERTDGRCFF